MMVFGHLFAALTGASLPLFSFLMGNVFDSFSPENSRDEQLKTVTNITEIFVGIGFAVWLFSYIYWYLLLAFSVRVSTRIKERYLKQVLRQECAWYDGVNYTEFASKISQETQNIQRALGDKAG